MTAGNDKAGDAQKDCTDCSTSFRLTEGACKNLEKWYKNVGKGEVDVEEVAIRGFKSTALKLTSWDKKQIYFVESDFHDDTFTAAVNWISKSFYKWA